MKFLSRLKSVSIATIIVALVAGILFIAFPAQCIQYISLALGIALIGIGIAAVISYFVKNTSAFMLLLGIISAVTGIIVCVRYRTIISIIIIIFGVFILSSGVVDLVTGIKTVFTYKAVGAITIILSIVTIVLGILAITRSSDVSESIVRFVGVAFIIYAVLDTFAFFEVHSFVKKAKNAVTDGSDIFTDAVLLESDPVEVETE